jgi:hypothetical protein
MHAQFCCIYLMKSGHLDRREERGDNIQMVLIKVLWKYELDSAGSKSLLVTTIC